jgi:NitT/TauT family transport system permease protein
MTAGTVSGGRARAGTRRGAARWAVPSWIITLISVIVVAAIWEAVARAWNFLFFPPVTSIIGQVWVICTNGSVGGVIGGSIAAAASGIAIAAVAGVLIGAAMGLSEIARVCLGPYVDALMSAPMVAFVPLFIMVFGLGFETRVVVVAMYAFFAIAVNTEAGMRTADPELLMMARSFGVSRAGILFKVRIPAAWPQVRNGLRLGASRGIEGVITGEVLIATAGLGGLIGQFSNSFRYDRVYAVGVVIVVMALIAVALVVGLGKITLSGWSLRSATRQLPLRPVRPVRRSRG